MNKTKNSSEYNNEHTKGFISTQQINVDGRCGTIQGIAHGTARVNNIALFKLREKLIGLHGSKPRMYIDLNVLTCPDGQINADMAVDSNAVIFVMDNVLATLNENAKCSALICEITYKTNQLFTKRILEWPFYGSSIVLSLDNPSTLSLDNPSTLLIDELSIL